MGNGIAHVFAQFGYAVTLNDIRDDLLEKGMKTIAANIDRQIKKGALTEAEKDPAGLARITDLDSAGVANADLVIEAATENRRVKTGIFRDIAASAPADAILASNTSSISITEIAAVTGRARPGDRHAFHEPGPGHEARGGDPGTVHRRRDDRGRPGGGAEPRKDTGGGQRLPGIHLQPGAAAR